MLNIRTSGTAAGVLLGMSREEVSGLVPGGPFGQLVAQLFDRVPPGAYVCPDAYTSELALLTGYGVAELTGLRRPRSLTLARKAAAVVMRARGYSVLEIGEAFCRDHSTVGSWLEGVRAAGGAA